MKKLFFSISILSVLAFGAISASAQQCDRNTMSPIRCGFYEEGYQDGVSDANSSRISDYRRYRTKYVPQYESFYRDGYGAGHDSVRPSIRWTGSQRAAYNSGYTLGQSDRRSGNQGRAGSEAGRSYDQNIGLYFQQGYTDGFDNRPRRYDFQIDGMPTDPGPGTGTSGTASWGGRVDDRANIIIRGNTIRTEDASYSGVQVAFQNINGSLPRRATTVTARRTSGRGEVFVIQQPSRGNDWTAIIQVVDARPGSSDYRIEIAWGGSSSGGIEETYRPGSVRWRGRVDQAVNIVISGRTVESQDASGTGISDVDYDLTGSLARRAGSIMAVKRYGRGTIRVIQQPSADNDYMAIVQVFDPANGADDYEVDISW